MAIGFKIDAKTGEPLHLVFAGESTVIDYENDENGNPIQVTRTSEARKPADDEWFPADVNAVIKNMTAPAEQRMSFAKLQSKFPVMDAIDWKPDAKGKSHRGEKAL